MLYFILGAIKLRTRIIITDLFDENMGIFSNSFITLTGVELSLYRFNKFDKIISVGTKCFNEGCRKKQQQQISRKPQMFHCLKKKNEVPFLTGTPVKTS